MHLLIKSHENSCRNCGNCPQGHYTWILTQPSNSFVNQWRFHTKYLDDPWYPPPLFYFCLFFLNLVQFRKYYVLGSFSGLATAGIGPKGVRHRRKNTLFFNLFKNWGRGISLTTVTFWKHLRSLLSKSLNVF